MPKTAAKIPTIEQLLQNHVNRRVIVLALEGPEQILLKGILHPSLQVEGERIHRYLIEKGLFQVPPKDVLMVTEEPVKPQNLEVVQTPPSRVSAGYEVETR